MAVRRGAPSGAPAVRSALSVEVVTSGDVRAPGLARWLARRQAAEAGHPMATELRVLALHGLLHLLGYDHEEDQGQMSRIERRLRRLGGLREGLIERS